MYSIVYIYIFFIQSSVYGQRFLLYLKPFSFGMACHRASLVAQAVKSLPAMQETWVGLDRVAWWATVHGVMKSRT